MSDDLVEGLTLEQLTPTSIIYVGTTGGKPFQFMGLLTEWRFHVYASEDSHEVVFAASFEIGEGERPSWMEPESAQELIWASAHLHRHGR